MTASAARVLNLGEEITLKSLGTVRVRELSLEQILLLAEDLALLIEEVGPSKLAVAAGDEKAEEEAGMKWLLQALKNPALAKTVRKIAAYSMRVKEDEVEMGIGDWLKWLVKFKEVTDWAEIKELFLQLAPDLPKRFQLRTSERKSVS